MSKSRMTITLTAEEDAAVRAAAEKAGLDLSAFLRVAALAEVSRINRVEARFAEIDEVSRSVETAPSGVDGPPTASPKDETAMSTFLDALDNAFTKRHGGAAA